MKEVTLRNVIALCKLQTFPHMFVCQKNYPPQSWMPCIFTRILHCLLNEIAFLLHIPFSSERQDFS